MKKEKEFNVLDMSAWAFASIEKGFVWGEVAFVKGNEDFTEIVNLLINAKSFIDKFHSGDIQKQYGKIDIIVCILDGLSEHISIDVVLAKLIEKITCQHRLFDIFDSKSWRWARKTTPFL
jgi:hypothetical protein